MRCGERDTFRRRSRPRSKTLAAKRASGEIASPIDETLFADRPKTRRDCLDGSNAARPCPWVSCPHHLYLEVTAAGSLKLTFPDREPEDLTDTCTLDVADGGGSTLDEIGEILNVSRERVRQVEAAVLVKVKREMRR